MKNILYSIISIGLCGLIFMMVPSVIGTGTYDILDSACTLGGQHNAIEINCQDPQKNAIARHTLSTLWPRIQKFESTYPIKQERVAQLEKLIDAVYLKSQSSSNHEQQFIHETVHFYLTIFLHSYSTHDTLYGYH